MMLPYPAFALLVVVTGGYLWFAVLMMRRG
jgi:hypothetical protein